MGNIENNYKAEEGEINTEASVAEKGNVLVLGNSGVGKSTLINAIVGDEVAKTGRGTEGTTDRLEIYESTDPNVLFNIVDSVGFEPSVKKRKQAIKAVKRWSKESLKSGGQEKAINVCLFCVDGTSAKIFDQTIDSMVKAVSVWKGVPIIVVITKSYSEIEREQNIELVKAAISKNKTKNLGKWIDNRIIPVVAKVYPINDDVAAVPFGIDTLIETINDAMPSGKEKSKEIIEKYVLKRVRALAQGNIALAASAAALAGTRISKEGDIPKDSTLETVVIKEVRGIAKTYGINEPEILERISTELRKKKVVSNVGNMVLKANEDVSKADDNLKQLPCVVLATVIAVGIGETFCRAFDQYFKGEEKFDDFEWIDKLIEEKFNEQYLNEVRDMIALLPNINFDDVRKVVEIVLNVYNVVVAKRPPKFK